MLRILLGPTYIIQSVSGVELSLGVGVFCAERDWEVGPLFSFKSTHRTDVALRGTSMASCSDARLQNTLKRVRQAKKAEPISGWVIDVTVHPNPSHILTYSIVIRNGTSTKYTDHSSLCTSPSFETLNPKHSGALAIQDSRIAFARRSLGRPGLASPGRKTPMKLKPLKPKPSTLQFRGLGVNSEFRLWDFRGLGLEGMILGSIWGYNYSIMGPKTLV